MDMIRQLFSHDWQVIERKGMFGLPQDSKPKTVTLPYDAMFYTSRDPGAPFLNGSYPGGKWEYKKTFFVPDDWSQKKLCFYFEGVYQRALIYINGDCAASHAYGYTPFTVEADRFLRYGADNEVKVIVHIADGARWYSGAGLCRDVYLLTSDLVHIEPQGVRITTPAVDSSLADVAVATNLRNDSASAKITVKVATELLDETGNVVAADQAPVTILRHEAVMLRQKLYVVNPQLWDLDTPNLYQCRTRVTDNEGNVLDENTETFGIRSFRLSPQSGLSINGRPIKLQGAALHHDNGPAGAITLDCIEERRLNRLKAAGFNAVRTAHNPPGPALYRACDKLGLLVMAEAFDTWTVGKVDFDNTLDFAKNWQDDLTAMVGEAFNHPCVLMYSIGNEIAETGSANGSELGRRITEELRALDPTRYIINCINGMVSVMSLLDKMREDAASQQQPGQQGQNAINEMMSSFGDVMRQIMMLDVVTTATAESFACVDIGGYNYMDARYTMDHQLFPNRIICGTETLAPSIDQVWHQVMTNSHVIGDFVWTGWDYLGEPATGLVKYAPPPPEYGMGCPYPALLSMVGEFTICGNRRPMSYYHEIVLGQRREPYLAVQHPAHYSDLPIGTPWSWSDSVGSWSWNGFEGNPVKVEVYSDADEVELLLDGQSLGRSPAGPSNRYKAIFETIYHPGELTAVAISEGAEKSRFSLRSAVGSPILAVTLEKPEVSLNDREMIYVQIKLADASGEVFVNNPARVRVEIAGPAELVGFGTDDPLPTENLYDIERALFMGQALLVLRPTAAGQINIELISDQFGKSHVATTVS